MIVDIRDIDLTMEKYEQLLTLYNSFASFDKNIFTFERLKEIVSKLNDNHFILLYIVSN